MSSNAIPHPELPAPHVGYTHVGGPRLLIGLLQGGLLYLLYRAFDGHAWPATAPQLFAPLALVALLAPVLLVSGVGHMARRSLLLWALTAAVVLAVLGWYDAWRIADLPLPQPKVYKPAQSVTPTAPLVMFSIIGLFIAHALVLAAARDGRPVARHATYFDVAWKLGVQLGFSALFVGVTWLVLGLGAQLFELIKLDFLTRLLRKPWFWIPVSTFAFACAMQLTDVRPAIVRGIRGLALTLMSWLLPVAVLLVAGFLASLPFTGLAPLWATRHAATVLLLAAALFVGLVNAAWQDGSEAVAPARPVRVGARVAAVLLVPIVALAIHALALRVADYGWTVERVQAAACMLVAACYALGYAWAASRRGWLPTLDRVNTATAFVILAVIVLVFSPLVDPARIAVHSQLARLASGRVSAQHFDFVFLRFDGARFGRAALDRLDSQATGPDAALVRQRSASARKLGNKWDRGDLDKGQADLAANLRAHPAGTLLPATLLRTDFSGERERWGLPACLYLGHTVCDVVLLDVNGDGKPEAIVLPDNGSIGVLGEIAPGQWRLIGTASGCLRGPARKALLDANAHGVEPALRDIEAGGKRLHLNPVDPPNVGACAAAE
jgi:energy-converting hydrogenase Eha subunit A